MRPISLPLSTGPAGVLRQSSASAGVVNWAVDELQMSSPPIALGPSAVPVTSNLFNFAAANQPRWDRFLFSCYPQEQPRDRFCQELHDFCPQDLTNTVCATTWAVPSVNHELQRGHLGRRGHLGDAGGFKGERCVCLMVLCFNS